jgi:hypothetical protein
MDQKVTYAASDEVFQLLRDYIEKCQKLWDEFGMAGSDGFVFFEKESPKLMQAIRDYEDKINYAPDKKTLEDLIFRATKNWEKVFKRRAAIKQEEKEKEQKLATSAFKGVIKNYAEDIQVK